MVDPEFEIEFIYSQVVKNLNYPVQMPSFDAILATVTKYSKNLHIEHHLYRAKLKHSLFLQLRYMWSIHEIA